MLRKTIVITIAALVLIGGALYITIPPPYPGIFDSNLNKLVESVAEARCAGKVFWDTRNKGDRDAMKRCVAASSFPKERNHSQVVPNFCLAAIDAGVPAYYGECVAVMTERRLWPTAAGFLTDAFNENYPWPGDVFPGDVPVDNSRTGEREGFAR